METKQPQNASLSYEEMLKTVIVECYERIRKDARANLKIGEWMKMMELHRKLSPGNSDRKEFWKMLEEIRREQAQPGTAGAKSAKEGKRARGRAGK